MCPRPYTHLLLGDLSPSLKRLVATGWLSGSAFNFVGFDGLSRMRFIAVFFIICRLSHYSLSSSHFISGYITSAVETASISKLSIRHLEFTLA
jgi:hypothetical protein